ncbi:MAG: DUF1804 family protein [Desulfobulbaceae bacterium]|jgi:transcriptional regulator with XRE-family HTH domain|nr:DUF1804 family protein [Desulfobulbaceae bacterium]
MATKGDRGHLEPQATRLYADGRSMSEIAALLGVSATSLSRWKSESQRPGDEMDGWERARRQKRSNIARLRDLFEDQLAYLEAIAACDRSPGMMDTLSKMGALLERWDKVEKAQRIVEAVFEGKETPKTMTAEELQAKIKSVYGI